MDPNPGVYMEAKGKVTWEDLQPILSAVKAAYTSSDKHLLLDQVVKLRDTCQSEQTHRIAHRTCLALESSRAACLGAYNCISVDLLCFMIFLRQPLFPVVQP